MSFCYSLIRSNNESAIYFPNQSINQSINQLASQSVNEAISQSAFLHGNKLTCKVIIQSANGYFKQISFPASTIPVFDDLSIIRKDFRMSIETQW